jgi:hypothetical protein
MSKIDGRFTQTAEERRRYILNYSLTLSGGERVSVMGVPVVTQTFGKVSVAPFVIDGLAIGPDPFTSVVFYASGGDDATIWEIQFLATTSTGQIIEDVVEFTIDGDL